MRINILNKTYIRFFIYLSITITLTFGIFTTFFLNQFSQYASRELENYLQDKLEHTVQNMDFILQGLKNYGLSMYDDKDISNWLFSNEKDPMLEALATNSAAKYIANQPFIHKAYLINMKQEMVIDTKQQIYSFDEFTEKRILDRVLKIQPDFLSFSEYETKGKSYLTLFIPSTLSKRAYFGYLVLVVDKELLEKYVMDESNKSGVEIMVVDERKKLILGNIESEIKDLAIEGINKNEEKSFEIKYNHETAYVNYKQMESQKWIVVYINHFEFLQSRTNSFKYIIFFSLSFLAMIIMATVFFGSKYMYKPFSALVEQIKGKFKIEDKVDSSARRVSSTDYNIIENTIEFLSTNIDNLSSSLRNHKDLIKAENLRRWILLGKMNPPISEYISSNTKLLSYKTINIVVIRIEAYQTFLEKYDFSSQKLMKFAMVNIAEELISNQNWVCEGIDFGSDHVVLLVGRNNEDFHSLLQVLENINKEIENLQDIDVVIASSYNKNPEEDIKRIYDTIYEITMLKFIWGEDKVYEESDLEKYAANIKANPDESLLKELIQSIRLGNTEETKHLLKEFIQNMRGMTYADCKLQLTIYIYTIIKSFTKQTSIQNIGGINNFLDQFDTLEGVSQWLEEEINRITLELASKKNANRKEELILQIVEYIKNHLSDPMLTIEEVADHISLSAGYVRHIFKEVFNTTLSDYIQDERINSVKKLLATTEWAVTDIAERCGFQTKSSFFTSFKKNTGVTPNQYRIEVKKGEGFHEV